MVDRFDLYFDFEAFAFKCARCNEIIQKGNQKESIPGYFPLVKAMREHRCNGKDLLNCPRCGRERVDTLDNLLSYGYDSLCLKYVAIYTCPNCQLQISDRFIKR